MDLSPSETLCFGRCHVGVKITRDLAVLCFGSGHPSTNGILGYDLASDQILRLPPPTTTTQKGFPYLPSPRFTAAAAVCPNQYWLIVHGGYSTQAGRAIGDTVVLDLAPQMKRHFSGLDVISLSSTTTVEAVGSGRCIPPPSHRPVLDSDVHSRRDQQNQNRTFSVITNWMTRIATAQSDEQRQQMAQQFLTEGANMMREINPSTNNLNNNSLYEAEGAERILDLLRTIAGGTAVLGMGDEDEADDGMFDAEHEIEEEEDIVNEDGYRYAVDEEDYCDEEVLDDEEDSREE